jgi:hypothetical protein
MRELSFRITRTGTTPGATNLVARKKLRRSPTFSPMLGAMLSAGVLLTAVAAQTPSGVPDQNVRQEATSHAGMATGGVHTAEFDKEHRPITAGGFLKTGPVIFLNTADQAGLTTWHHTAGAPEKRFILEANGAGVALLDYDNDGWLDIYMVNGTTYEALDGKATPPHAALFHNNHDGTFTDVAAKAGVTNDRWGYGAVVADYDNDGWKDLLLVNGHTYPEVDKQAWGTSYAQRPLLFHNLQNGKFELMPAVEGTGLAVVSVARGAAFGDLFNNGKIDVVLNGVDQVPVLLRNVNPDHHHWVELKLIGGPKSPRDAVGATVYLTAGGIRQRGDVLSGGSYLSSNDFRVHFGLGDVASVDHVEIHWPSGAQEQLKLSAVDRILTVEEGKGVSVDQSRENF